MGISSRPESVTTGLSLGISSSIPLPRRFFVTMFVLPFDLFVLIFALADFLLILGAAF